MRLPWAPVELTGFAPAPAARSEPRRRQEDRPERERSRNSSSSGGSYGGGNSSGSSSGGYAPRREKVDPWFLKPYEPEAPATQTDAQAEDKPAAGKAKTKVAALLGGLTKRS